MQTEQRNRVIQELGKTSGFIYVKGGKTTNRQWTDSENLFRQESNFYYLTGINTPDLHLLIDLTLNNNFLFLPEYLYSKDHQVWCGKYFDFKEIKNLYGLDCLLESELKSFVKDSLVYILEGTETDFKNIETTSLKRYIETNKVQSQTQEFSNQIMNLQS